MTTKKRQVNPDIERKVAEQKEKSKVDAKLMAADWLQRKISKSNF